MKRSPSKARLPKRLDCAVQPLFFVSLCYALQQELAQLKRTPSMQLLARQRIPRLEEAIKHLIAEIQASAKRGPLARA